MLAAKHVGSKHAWPSRENVDTLKRETAEGMIPLIVQEGDALSSSGRYRTMGTHETLTRGGVQVGEFIRLPSNLFEGEKVNEDRAAVLVHEYCHALQNVSMRNLPEMQRARIPIPSIEYANQALAMKAWDEMSRIKNAGRRDGVYWDAKRDLIKEFGKNVFNDLPDVMPKTMRYQDRMSRFPGVFFMEEHPDFFEEKEKRLEVRVREKYFKNIEENLMKQYNAAQTGYNINEAITKKTFRKTWENKKARRYDDFLVNLWGTTQTELNAFKPELGNGELAEAKDILHFYEREAEHLREISRLEEMRLKLERGQLPSRELVILHDYATRNEFQNLLGDFRGIKHERLIDYALSHKLGQIEANRITLEEAAGMLGRVVRGMHETGYMPEEKFAEIIERQKWWDSPARKRELEGLREMGRKAKRETRDKAGLEKFSRREHRRPI